MMNPDSSSLAAAEAANTYWMDEPIRLTDIAEQINAIMQEEGLSLQDLLAGREADGDAFFREYYGQMIHDPA
jgi:hypothetical protein